MASHNLQPLKGQTIAVTRMRDQADGLCRFLRSAGAEVIEAPTIEIGPIEDYGEVDDALRHLDRYQWLVLTSANGVDAMFARMEAARARRPLPGPGEDRRDRLGHGPATDRTEASSRTWCLPRRSASRWPKH